MNSIVAICGSGDPSLRKTRAREMLAGGRSASPAGSGSPVVLEDARQILLCGSASEARNEITFARSASASVLCNSRLTYKADLIHSIGKLRALPDQNPGDAALALLAYEQQGVKSFASLEGDFTLILWDSSSNTLFAARDILGRRRLLYSRVDSELIVASSMKEIRAHPAVSSEMNEPFLGKYISQMWGHGNETIFSRVFDVPAGHYIAYTPGKNVIIRKFWQTPEVVDDKLSTDDAARILRDLLSAAVREQLAIDKITAVSMSGGWDSTAVFATGQNLIRTLGDSRTLAPVSVSYPVGDSGREDETIATICAAWGVRPNWIDVNSVQLLHALEEKSRRRAEPFSHFFDEWHRALFRKARETGANRILDGYGGDNLFQVSSVYIADLLASLRIAETIRQWRARGGGTPRDFVKTAILPNVTGGARELISRLRGGKRLRLWWERQPAPFLRKPFLTQHQLTEDEFEQVIQLPRSATLAEMHSYIHFPFFGRVNHSLREIALEEGVDQGSPLFDGRIIRFAATRPWHERTNMNESKILLRRAMRGLLPDEVLAPRAKRTGTPETFFRQAALREVPVHVDRISQNSLLGEMGIIAPAAFKWAWDRYAEGRDAQLGAQVLATIQTEYWLREQFGKD